MEKEDLPALLLPYFEVFQTLEPIFQKWASVSSTFSEENGRWELENDLKAFSEAWRRTSLPKTNKLHLLEAHLADFFELHRNWALYGEQGIESLHHIGNLAIVRCFGVNQDHSLAYFMKRQLIKATTKMPSCEDSRKPSCF